jgi:hypothetical protein
MFVAFPFMHILTSGYLVLSPEVVEGSLEVPVVYVGQVVEDGQVVLVVGPSDVHTDQGDVVRPGVDFMKPSMPDFTD